MIFGCLELILNTHVYALYTLPRLATLHAVKYRCWGLGPSHPDTQMCGVYVR